MNHLSELFVYLLRCCVGMYVCLCVRRGEEVSSGMGFGKGSLNLEPCHTVIQPWVCL